MVARGAILVNYDRCIGCRTCSAVCYDSHREKGFGMVEFSPIEEPHSLVPQYCRHCDQPACAEACPTGALQKVESGEVVRRPGLCVGCRSCSYACPFGVIEPMLRRHLPPKCDGCASLVDSGGMPLCVSICPSGALEYVPAEELEKREILGVPFRGYQPFWRRS